MSVPDPETRSEEAFGEQPAAEVRVAPESAAAPPTPEPARRSYMYMGFWALGIGLMAGLVSWGVGEWTHTDQPQIQLPPNFRSLSPYEKDAVTSRLTLAALPWFYWRRTVATYGLLAALLGAGLGILGGWVQRSPRWGLGAGGVGIVMGAGAVTVLSAVLVPLFFKYHDKNAPTLIDVALTQAGIWLAVGATGGLALGLGLGRHHAGAAFGGVLGALIATFVYEPLIAVYFPDMRTDEPIPTQLYPRLLSHLCVAVFVALGAVLAVRERRARVKGKLARDWA
jgi:hypothetical protein